MDEGKIHLKNYLKKKKKELVGPSNELDMQLKRESFVLTYFLYHY